MIVSSDVINFWFHEIEPSKWWKKDVDFDDEIARRFAATLKQAAACELYAWRGSPAGRLAEIIVLDQFSRNIHRDTAQAFAADALALALAQEAIACGADQALPPNQRNFLYMPYMHSESLAIHEVAVELFTANDQANNLDFELRHKAIIERFGRYPHRNSILQRNSTPEEIVFLNEPGSSF